MQRQGGDAATRVITGRERSFQHRLRVDWNQDGNFTHALSVMDHLVDNISVERSLKGSAPQEILLIEGSAAAELKFSLSGEYAGQLMPSIFSPYNRKSPLYGKTLVGGAVSWDIIVETPLGNISYPQFRGYIRTVTPNRADNTISVTALDRVELLRKPINMANWAASEQAEQMGKIDSQLCHSHWVIDSALRMCDVGCAPWRPKFQDELGLPDNSAEGVQLFVTGNGSFIPTVGWLENPKSCSFPTNPGVMYSTNAALNPNAPLDPVPQRVLGLSGLGAGVSQKLDDANGYGILRYWCADREAVFANGVHYLGFTLNTNGTAGTTYQSIGQVSIMELACGGQLYAYVDVNAGKVRGRIHHKSTNVQYNGPWVNIPTDQDHVEVRAIFQLADFTAQASEIYCEAGNNNSGWFTLPVYLESLSLPSDVLRGRVTVAQALPISDIFVNSRFQDNVQISFDHTLVRPTYAAVLDRGINRLNYLPTSGGRVDGGGKTTATSAWDIITAVASAEFGSVFWDENGVFRFWNFNTMLSKQNTIVREFDLDQVSGLQLTNTLDACRNIYTVTTNRKRTAATVKIFDSNDVDQFVVGAGQTKSFRVFANDVVAVRPYNLIKCDTDETSGLAGVAPPFDEDMIHGYCTQYNFPDLGWYEAPDRVEGTRDVQAYMNRDGMLTVRIHNGWEFSTRRGKGGSGTSQNFPDGGTSSPALRISGALVAQGTPITLSFRNQVSIDKYGPRILDLSGDWMQDAVALTDIVGVLMPRTADPIPVTDAITIAGDPRLQLGDTIAVSDTDGFGDFMRMQILGISRRFERDGGLTDTLSVEMLRPTAAPIPGGTVFVPLPDTDPDPSEIPQLPVDGGIYRRNLCTNPSLSVDTTGWYGPQGSGRTTTAEGMPRNTGYLVERSGQAQGPKVRAEAGKYYRLSCYIKGVNGESPGQVLVAWYTNSSYLSASDDKDFIVRTGITRRADCGVVQAPSNATRMRLCIDGITSGGVIITGALYEGPFNTRSEATLEPYFDGDSDGAEWDGTAGRSASVLTVQGAPVGGEIPDPDPQPANPTNSAAHIFEWGTPLPSSDTFDYTNATNTPDPGKWSIMGEGGTQGGDECWIGFEGNGRRCTGQLVLAGDRLEIHGDSLGDSGGVMSVLDQRYGRWEVRARFRNIGVSGSAYRPTMVLYPQSEVLPQMGLLEFTHGMVGGTSITSTLHKPADTDINRQFVSETIDLTQYHNYGFEWNSQGMIGYIDGVEWYRLEDPTYNSGGPMHLRLQLDNLFGTSMRAASMDVQWARVYPLTPIGDPGGGPGFAADVFVDPAGNDSNTGLSPTVAKRTLAAAMSIAQPGDTISCAAGTYSGNFTTSKGGNAAAGHITIRSAEKHAAIISGTSSGTQAAVTINHPYIRIQDMTITGTVSSGVRMGILVDASNIEIKGNRIHQICQFLTEGTSFQGGAGIDFAGGNISNILIDGNLIYNIGLASSTQQLVHGMYLSAHVTNGRLLNNVIHDCEDFGFHAYDIEDASGWQIINNTVAECGRGILQSTNGITRNNWVYNTTGRAYDIRGTGNTGSNNRFGGTGTGATGTSVGATSATPSFVNASANDYRLNAGSPGVNQGTSTGAPTTDHNGVTRPVGGTVDIGAFER